LICSYSKKAIKVKKFTGCSTKLWTEYNAGQTSIKRTSIPTVLNIKREAILSSIEAFCAPENALYKK